VLARDAAVPLQLTEAAQPRLGWNSWIAPPDRLTASDATDAVFEIA
jgi:predicted component of type VI protein secretion system